CATCSRIGMSPIRSACPAPITRMGRGCFAIGSTLVLDIDLDLLAPRCLDACRLAPDGRIRRLLRREIAVHVREVDQRTRGRPFLVHPLERWTERRAAASAELRWIVLQRIASHQMMNAADRSIAADERDAGRVARREDVVQLAEERIQLMLSNRAGSIDHNHDIASAEAGVRWQVHTLCNQSPTMRPSPRRRITRYCSRDVVAQFLLPTHLRLEEVRREALQC